MIFDQWFKRPKTNGPPIGPIGYLTNGFFLANGSFGELMDRLVCEVEGIDKKLRAESSLEPLTFLTT